MGCSTCWRRATRSASWQIELLGGWFQVVIDVFTHSADYHVVPLLYPITARGFDGFAWNTPWVLARSYAALAAVFQWFYRSGKDARVG